MRMCRCLRRFSPTPMYTTEEDQIQITRLFTMLLRGFVCSLLAWAAVAVPFLVVRRGAALVLVVAVVGLWGVASAVLRTGRLRLAALIWLTGLWSAASTLLLFGGGIRGATGGLFFALPITAGLVFGVPGAIGALALSGLTLGGVALLEAVGHLPPVYFPFPLGAASTLRFLLLAWTAIPVVIFAEGLRRALRTARLQLRQRDAAQTRLQQSRQQLRALAGRVERLREAERTQMARDIHDHLGQLLTALTLELGRLRHSTERLRDSEVRQVFAARVDAAARLADDIIESVEQVARQLRPSVLDRLGLVPAIRGEVRLWQQRTEVPCTLEVGSEPTLAPDQAIGVFRILQELLTNIARHAQATAVTIRLRADGTQLIMEVEDNGTGIRLGGRDQRGLGILGMQERARELGGTIRFRRRDPQGTRVRLHLPLAANAEASDRVPLSL